MGGDGRTDIRTHDDADRLAQRQDARVNEADRHNGRRGRGLDDGSNHSAHQQRAEQIASHTFQRPLERGASGAFQAVAHDRHTVEEQGKPARHPDQGQEIKSHKQLLPRALCKKAASKKFRGGRVKNFPNHPILV